VLILGTNPKNQSIPILLSTSEYMIGFSICRRHRAWGISEFMCKFSKSV